MINPRWELPRSTASAAILVGVGEDFGVLADELLTGTGISQAALEDPNAEITAAQELVLVQNLVAALPDVPGLGLIAGSRYRTSTHGIFGFAIMSSPNVGVALDVVLRYFDLSFSLLSLAVERTDDEVLLVFDASHVPPDVGRFQLERDWTIMLREAQGFVPGEVFAERIEVTFDDPGYSELYRELGAAPTFNAPRNLVAISASLLSAPMLQSDPRAATLFERECAELLNRRRERLGVSGAVRDVLLRTRRFTSDQDEVAGSLAMSVRTLRRRLADEGTSYREIVAETSGMLAEELLRTGLTVEDVAHRLGYSSASSFTVAFRSWKGISPGSYARSARAR